MKYLPLIILILLLPEYIKSQHNSSPSKEKSILDNVATEVCSCFTSTTDTTQSYLNQLLLKECVEEATEEHLSEILKMYQVNTFKEIQLKQYIDDLKPKLKNKCSLSYEFINNAFRL